MAWCPGESILYFDHKFKVCENHILKANAICKTDLLIRNTPKKKVCIQDEIDAAINQKRYLYSMPETIEWVNSKIKSGEYSYSNRIMNTGFILYKDIRFKNYVMKSTKLVLISVNRNVKSFGEYYRKNLRNT